jgi:GTPase SAR1 family protein
MYKPGEALSLFLTIKNRKGRPPLLAGRSSKWMRPSPAWLDFNDRFLFAQKTIDEIGIGGTSMGMFGDEVLTNARASVMGKTSMADLIAKAMKTRPDILTRTDVEYLSFFESAMTDFSAGLLPATLQDKIRVLILCYNELDELRISGNTTDPSAHSMKSLLELYASNNRISTIAPRDIECLVNLRVIDLRHNSLKSLPVEVFNLLNLERLDVSENSIEVIPPEIGQLKKLQIFYASQNQLEALPQEIGNAVQLRDIDISENKIRKLPLTMSFLTKLRVIKLDENPLREPPRNIVNDGAEAVVSFLRELMKGGEPCLRMKLMFVGQENVGKTSLLRAMASEVKSRQDPKAKDADSAVSSSIQVSGRPVSTDGIGSCFAMFAILILSDFDCFPADIHTLSIEVEFSDQDGIGQSTLASTTPKLTGLSGMVMSAMKNTKSTLSKLTNTDTSSSTSSKVSLQLPNTNSTSSSSSDGLQPASPRGQSSVGILADSVSQAKHAVAVASIKKQDLQFSCWDFGGQEVYYTTHSFFLTERSIFLVVFNLALGANNCRVEYWLNSIKARAPKAAIILVGTHLDDPEAGGVDAATSEMDSLLTKYKKSFRIRGALAVATSLAKPQNISSLVDKLVELARAEPLLRGRVPTSYCTLSLQFDVENCYLMAPSIVMLEERCMIEKTKRARAGEPPVMFWDELKEIAVNCSLIPRKPSTQEQADLADRDLDRAIDTLHLLGSITRFKDAGSGLDKVVVRESSVLWLPTNENLITAPPVPDSQPTVFDPNICHRDHDETQLCERRSAAS